MRCVAPKSCTDFQFHCGTTFYRSLIQSKKHVRTAHVPLVAQGGPSGVPTRACGEPHSDPFRSSFVVPFHELFCFRLRGTCCSFLHAPRATGTSLGRGLRIDCSVTTTLTHPQFWPLRIFATFTAAVSPRLPHTFAPVRKRFLLPPCGCPISLVSIGLRQTLQKRASTLMATAARGGPTRR